MEPKKYRVEVFITPKINKRKENINTSNEIVQEKFLNKIHLDVIEEVTEQDENATDIKEPTEQDVETTNIKELSNVLNESHKEKSLSDVAERSECNNTFSYTEERIYDEPYIDNCSIFRKNLNNFLATRLSHPLPSIRYSQRYAPKPPKRSSSLKSIDENAELLEQNFIDICYHGHKNGCTVAVQQPEDVSQEIFKENWLQKLEGLRQREALLRDKEMALQSQERLLFKKERQLRILERLIKDKMKQADLYLKRCKNIPGFEKIMENEHSSESGFSNSSKSSKRENIDELSDKSSDTQNIYDEIKNPPNSRSSLTSGLLEVPKPPVSLHSEKPSRFISHSFRLKPRPKLTYDDLDSTLSADVGDSSYITTSKKFNPEIFKKPMAFTRSVSERRPKCNLRKNNWNSKLPPISSASEHYFEETKLLKKVSENILVSQNKETKFQNYGLIDDRLAVNPCDTKIKIPSEVDSMNSKKYSYLDLESGSKTLKSKVKKSVTDRPTSWSAETDNWLQKKRQAYNMTMKKMCEDNFDNKENRESYVKNEEINKTLKKKEKSRKFMIFR